MRVAQNDSDDRAGLRGYVQFNKYTYIHTYIHIYRVHTYIQAESGRSGERSRSCVHAHF